MEIRNGGAMWTDYVVNVYCKKLQFQERIGSTTRL